MTDIDRRQFAKELAAINATILGALALPGEFGPQPVRECAGRMTIAGEEIATVSNWSINVGQQPKRTDQHN